MDRFNRFIYGFCIGLLLPIGFAWLFLVKFYPVDGSIFEALQQIFPSALLGKLCLLSIIPDLGLVFVFYKSDHFKLASGILIGGMPYLIGSIFLL